MTFGDNLKAGIIQNYARVRAHSMFAADVLGSVGEPPIDMAFPSAAQVQSQDQVYAGTVPTFEDGEYLDSCVRMRSQVRIGCTEVKTLQPYPIMVFTHSGKSLDNNSVMVVSPGQCAPTHPSSEGDRPLPLPFPCSHPAHNGTPVACPRPAPTFLQ
ncbi:hypothetical protein OG21DRAFT_1527001 [Imleria badia]|nr:hypothetical protein OG21DRAFT_1527001 [Imleria badia]